MPEIRAASRAAHQDEHLIGQLKSMRALLGNILQPVESWLLDSRLPTLGLRMRHQGENAAQIVEALSEHPAIERIHYPSHFEEPEQRRIFEAQCDHPGAVFSLELSGGKKPAFDFLRSLSNSVSLGGIESLARHPATTTASEMEAVELLAAGVTDPLVRISVGVEDWRDLVADYEAALEFVQTSRPAGTAHAGPTLPARDQYTVH